MTDVQSDAIVEAVAEAIERVRLKHEGTRMEFYQTMARAAISSYLAAIAGAGLKVLSRMPTDAMIEAGKQDAIAAELDAMSSEILDIWYAIFDAAPPQPAIGEEGR